MASYYVSGRGGMYSSGPGYMKRGNYQGGGGGPKTLGNFGSRPDDFRKMNRDRRDGPAGPRRGGSRRRSRSPQGNSHSHDRSITSSSRGGKRDDQRQRLPGKHELRIPQSLLDPKEASVAHLKLRYRRMYIPSDFFHGDLRWQEAFPMHMPLKLGYRADFQVLHKEVNNLTDSKDTQSEVIDPTDADYTYSAKVMLLASPALSELYQKSCAVTNDTDLISDKMSADRQLHFLVGSGGKNEPMAIGGPWSESLDGPNPEENPEVLIKTAIRTCKSLTGIDLSLCTHWFRFMELHYYRPAERHTPSAPNDTATGTKPREARVETVVIFLPDIWSCMPNDTDWTDIKNEYAAALDKLINPPVVNKDEPMEDSTIEETSETPSADVSFSQEDEGGEETDEAALVEGDPTHFSKLDTKALKVADMKQELILRKLNSKGLKAQLTARLQKALDEEAAAEQKEKDAKEAVNKQETTIESDDKKPEDDTAAKEEDVPQEITEKERRRLERLYRMGDKPAIIVHPSREARGGRFDCHKMSLHALLDYRAEDQKEHTFEVSLFAEQFNEMIQRDCAFNIYKAIVIAPEKEGEKPDEDTEKTGDATVDTDVTTMEESEEPEAKRSRQDTATSESLPIVEGEEENKVKKVFRTVDTQLLFSFSYFDTAYVNQISDKDVEDIVQMLGLNLTRSQIRKLICKVTTKKGVVQYRTLTDKSIVEGTEEDIVTLRTELDNIEYLLELSQGNKALFDEAPPAIPPRIIINGGRDSEKLLDKMIKSENTKLLVELQYAQLQNELARTQKALTATNESESRLNATLADLKEKVIEVDHDAAQSRKLSDKYTEMLEFARTHLSTAMSNIEEHFEAERLEREAKKEAIKLEHEAAEKAKKDAELEAVNAIEKTNGDDTVEKKEEKGEWEVLDAV